MAEISRPGVYSLAEKGRGRWRNSTFAAVVAVAMAGLAGPDAACAAEASTAKPAFVEPAASDYSATANIARTRKYYATERSLRGPMLTDDFQFVEASTMPVTGVFKGLKGMMTITPTLLNLFDITKFQITEVTGGGDYTVALLDIHAQDLDESDIHMQVAEVFHWQKGKLKEIKPHWFDISELDRAIAAKRNRLK